MEKLIKKSVDGERVLGKTKSDIIFLGEFMRKTLVDMVIQDDFEEIKRKQTLN